MDNANAPYFDDDEIWERIIAENNSQAKTNIPTNIGEQDHSYQDNIELEEDFEYYEEDEEFEDGFEDAHRVLQKKNVAGQYSVNNQVKLKSFQPNDKNLERFTKQICLEKFGGLKYDSSVLNKIGENEKKEHNMRYRCKDKSDRATAGQALDQRTMLILQSLIKTKFINQIHGCFSTGKEANVYYGVDSTNYEYAIKVYKTSILSFKDRDKYVSGDYKFRNGYGKSNPRKMVRTWAEKEFSNLHKLHKSGIRVPQPKKLKNNVLIMEFIGKNSFPAPRLKDADISTSKSRELYLDVVLIMWDMYKVCKLVHADLSEFNILLDQGNLCIIDVSQSVTPDHLNAFDFLRSDCKNITDFFRKKGVPTMTTKELFYFIVDPSINSNNRHIHLERLKEEASLRDPFNITPQMKSQEEMFMEIFIPKTLNQVIDFEGDLRALRLGEKDADDLLYQSVLGLKSDLSGAKQTEVLEDQQSEVNENSSHSDGEDEESESEGPRRPLGRPKDESTEDRKMRKKAVKDERADKRQVKMKKHEKKRAVKVSKKRK